MIVENAHREPVERKSKTVAESLDERLLPGPTTKKRGDLFRLRKPFQRFDLGHFEELVSELDYLDRTMLLDVDTDLLPPRKRDERALTRVGHVEANIAWGTDEARLTCGASIKAQRLGCTIETTRESESSPGVRDDKASAISIKNKPGCSIALLGIEQVKHTVDRLVETNRYDVHDILPAVYPLDILPLHLTVFLDLATPTDSTHKVALTGAAHHTFVEPASFSTCGVRRSQLRKKISSSRLLRIQASAS